MPKSKENDKKSSDVAGKKVTMKNILCILCYFIINIVVYFIIYFVNGQEPLCEPTGGCIVNLPDEDNVPTTNPFVVSEIITDNSCAPFKKRLRAYGMLFLASTAGQDVPDNGLKWLAHAMTEMFPSTATDLVGQKKILNAMFRYRAADPIFTPKFINDMSPARDHVSLCDSTTIYFEETENNPNAQIMEVYEHLIHQITNVGLNHAFPTKWGIKKSSDLYKAMQQAITAKIYDVSSYAKADDEARLRLEMQEFAYKALSASTGMQATYISESLAPEWTLSSAKEVEEKLPLFWALHQETTAKWMGRIGNMTLTQIGNMAPGGPNPTTAPWPLIAEGRGTVSGLDTNLANVCKKQTSMPEGKTCGGGGGGGSSSGGAILNGASSMMLLVLLAGFLNLV
jgi:hypothetical protein